MNEMIDFMVGLFVAIIATGFVIWFLDAPTDSCKRIYHFWKRFISRMIRFVPHAAVMRLCLVVSVLFISIMFIQIPVDSGIGQIICGKKSCYIFGEPSWITGVAVFCAPFAVAKIIEFIIRGWE